MTLRSNTNKPIHAGNFVLDLINEVERRAKANSKEYAEIAERKAKQIKEG